MPSMVVRQVSPVDSDDDECCRSQSQQQSSHNLCIVRFSLFILTIRDIEFAVTELSRQKTCRTLQLTSNGAQTSVITVINRPLNQPCRSCSLPSTGHRRRGVTPRTN